MTLTTFCRITICVALLSTTLAAQSPDPFGGTTAPGDPFNQPTASSDPFGGSSKATDPFAQSSAGTDPFGGTSKATDPFARSPAVQNPFGDNTRGGPAKKTQTAAPSKSSAVAQTLRKVDPEEWIRTKLGDQTTMTAVELPLSDLVRHLSEAHDLPMVIDNRFLEEVGLSAEEPVTLSLKNVSLRSYLRIALHNFDLTYSIRDELLVITSLEGADRHPALRTYTLPESLQTRSAEVVKALTTTVTPDQWEMGGGPCTLAVVGSVLMVRATERVHEGVVDFLRKLNAAVNRR